MHIKTNFAFLFILLIIQSCQSQEIKNNDNSSGIKVEIDLDKWTDQKENKSISIIEKDLNRDTSHFKINIISYYTIGEKIWNLPHISIHNLIPNDLLVLEQIKKDLKPQYIKLESLDYDKLLTNTFMDSEISKPVFIEGKNVLLMKSMMPDKHNNLTTTIQAMHFLDKRIVIVQFMLFEKELHLYIEDFKLFVKTLKL